MIDPTRDERRVSRRLLDDTRYEILPTRGIADALEGVAVHIPVTVTASPAKGIGATVALAVALASAGRRTVPHIAAKRMVDAGHLREVLDELQEAGVDELLVVGGDGDAEGAYSDALGVLEDVAGHQGRSWKVGVAGYPDGHPSIPEPALMEALAAKAPFASEITTQMCFDVDKIARWVRTVREAGIETPVRIGIPGVVSRSRLISVGARIGVGDSLRYITRQRRVMRDVLAGDYSPTDMVLSLGAALAEPVLGIAGLHVYTFNEMAATSKWHTELSEALTTPA